MGSDPIGLVGDVLGEDFLALQTIILINMFPAEALILAYLCDSCEEFMSDQIAITLGWLGIEDTDTITVQMQDQRLIQDDSFYKNLMTQVALEHEVTQRGIIDLLAVKSQGVRGSVQKYSRYGDKKYIDGLPETTINTVQVDNAVVEPCVEADVGFALAIQEVSVKVPKETEWVPYRMTQLYGMNQSTQVFLLGAQTAIMTGYFYDYSLGEYKVTYTIPGTGTPAIPATYEVNTVTTGALAANETYIFDGLTITDQGAGSTAAQLLAVILGGADPNLVVTGALATTTVAAGSSGQAIYTSVVSGNVTDLVITGTGAGTQTLVITQGTNYVPAVPNTTGTLTIGNYVPNVGYVVRYIKDGTTDEYYWVYFIGGGNVELDNARNSLTNLDMLPIVELRKGSVSVTADKTSERYKQTKDILGIIGMDVDTMVDSLESNPDISSVVAAYVYFGAEIGSNNPLQAKLVYSTLEYLWLDPTTVSEGQHQIRVSEGSYNSSISWDLHERIVVTRTGVPVGTYEGGVGTASIDDGVFDEFGVWVPDIKNKYYGWVRKQETVDECVEYRVWNVSAVTVIMQTGLSDAAFRVLTPDTLIVMPISQHFLGKFSPIDQGKLFPEILRLVTYAADIQHLEYYQTEAFMTLVQIVMAVIAIVIFIFTWYTGGATAAAFLEAVGMVLAGMAVGYALKQLLLQIDNPVLRAIVAAIIVIVMAYTGNAAGAQDTVVLVANVVTEMVSTYADATMEGIAEQMAKLSMEAMTFGALVDKRQQELEDKQAGMLESILSTGEVAKLSNLEPVNAKIEGVDLRYYRAIQMQYEWDLVKSMKTQVAVYNYDTYYKLGIT